MPVRTSPRWWRGFLLASNAILPIPALILAGTQGVPGLWLLGITFVMHGLLLWAIMAPRVCWLGPLSYRFATNEKAVWLTIDDGPVGKPSCEISAALKARGVSATFFLIGSRLRQHREAAECLLRDGHTLANHTETHPRKSIWCAGRSRVLREVAGGVEALKEVGVTARWFRPPVGHKPPALAGVLRALGLRMITWETGGRDGWSADVAATAKRVIDGVRPGSVIVLHEGRAHSHATILAVVDALLEQGYRFVIPSDAQLESE